MLSIEVAGRRGRKGGWTEEIFHGEREEFSPDLYRFFAAKYLPFIRGVAAFIAATASHRDYILYSISGRDDNNSEAGIIETTKCDDKFEIARFSTIQFFHE